MCLSKCFTERKILCIYFLDMLITNYLYISSYIAIDIRFSEN